MCAREWVLSFLFMYVLVIVTLVAMTPDPPLPPRVEPIVVDGKTWWVVEFDGKRYTRKKGSMWTDSKGELQAYWKRNKLVLNDEAERCEQLVMDYHIAHARASVAPTTTRTP